MKLTKRDGMWHVLFKENGRWRRLGTGVDLSKSEEEATKGATEVLRKRLLEGAKIEPQAERSIGKAINLAEALAETFNARYKDTASGKAQLRYVNQRMQREIGHWLLTEITYKRLEEQRQKWLEEGTAPATVNRRMSHLKTVLKRSAQRGDIVATPEFPETMQENNVIERYFSEDEQQSIETWFARKAEAERHDPAGDGQWAFMVDFVTVLLDCGPRLGELTKVRECDGKALVLQGMQTAKKAEDIPPGAVVSLKERKKRQRGTKSAKTRRVPLTQRAAAAMARLLQHPLWGTKTLKDSWIEHRWDQCRFGLNLEEPGNAHICRHTFASRLLERGVDIYTVSKLMGHSSVKVTERYAALVKVQIFEQAISVLSRGPVLVSSSSSVDNSHVTRSTQELPVSKQSPDLCTRTKPK